MEQMKRITVTAFKRKWNGKKCYRCGYAKILTINDLFCSFFEWYNKPNRVKSNVVGTMRMHSKYYSFDYERKNDTSPFNCGTSYEYYKGMHVYSHGDCIAIHFPIVNTVVVYELC